MEYFSCLIQRAALDNQVPYHPRCKALEITHLCFADDLLVFTNGSIRGVAGINRVLAQFYRDSGLRSNPAKCQLFCCGTSVEEQQWISSFTGFPLGSLPVRYLGVPLISGKLTSADCSVLVDRITKRISTWQALKLSYAGRLQLVSSVITSIMQYWMALFLLPQKLLKAIENICNHFLWGVGDRSLRKRVLVAWKYVALPRREGGLGIRDFKKWNQACVIRHIWNLLAVSGSLWVAWVKKYRLKTRSIWEITGQSAGTWIWRKILKSREGVQSHISGSGESLAWDNRVLPRYSVKLVWKAIRESQEEVDWYKVVWGKPFSPKHSLLLWLVILNRITTKEKLQSWGLTDDSSCGLCPGGIETRDHLFSGCSYGRSVFVAVLSKFCRFPECSTWQDQLQWAIRQWAGSSGGCCEGRLKWSMCVSYIWRERCSRAHDGVFCPPSRLAGRIEDEAKWTLATRLS
ncbi:unnamed protein product [Linum trigynum]|uniref:Reverse transcriptase zinc-binding domain-containing protein n=1 Tax=Linum trigynum TaxID=586398 RepID=A0AAV2DRI3_9ROSI